MEIKHVGVAFSDLLAVVVKIRMPDIFSRVLCPRSKPHFKAKPEVVRDMVFNNRLKENFSAWSEIRQVLAL